MPAYEGVHPNTHYFHIRKGFLGILGGVSVQYKYVAEVDLRLEQNRGLVEIAYWDQEQERFKSASKGVSLDVLGAIYSEAKGWMYPVKWWGDPTGSDLGLGNVPKLSRSRKIHDALLSESHTGITLENMGKVQVWTWKTTEKYPEFKDDW